MQVAPLREGLRTKAKSKQPLEYVGRRVAAICDLSKGYSGRHRSSEPSYSHHDAVAARFCKNILGSDTDLPQAGQPLCAAH